MRWDGKEVGSMWSSGTILQLYLFFLCLLNHGELKDDYWLQCLQIPKAKTWGKSDWCQISDYLNKKTWTCSLLTLLLVRTQYQCCVHTCVWNWVWAAESVYSGTYNLNVDNQGFILHVTWQIWLKIMCSVVLAGNFCTSD